MKPHKHAELIKAWADGATIQMKDKGTGKWVDLYATPSWYNDYQYRIKPEEKKPVVRWKWAYKSHGQWIETEMFMTELEIEIRHRTFPVERYCKLEYTRTEFEE